MDKEIYIVKAIVYGNCFIDPLLPFIIGTSNIFDLEPALTKSDEYWIYQDTVQHDSDPTTMDGRYHYL